MITVIDVLREMGIEPEKRLSWKIGRSVVTRYKALYGHLPQKDLRTKTKGEGVHCFALYPDYFHQEVVEIINTYFDRRYSFCGRNCSIADLAELRGCSIPEMRRRLQSTNVYYAVRG